MITKKLTVNLPLHINLEQQFFKESSNKKGEIALFRAFIRVLNNIGPNSLAHEYHGNRYQVTFNALRGAGRSVPRCELCDVMIIYYPEGNPDLARFTFNQAKVTKKPLNYLPTTTLPYNFQANLEQWDLLSNRPIITSVTKKNQFPPDLLASAILPSIGTFGIFYPTNTGFDFAYFVANELSPLNNNSSAAGTLQWKSKLNQVRNINNYNEVTSACCMFSFGLFIEHGLIGTPIQPTLYGTSGSAEMQSWIKGILSSLNGLYPDSELPTELLMGLDLGREDISNVVKFRFPRSVALLKVNPDAWGKIEPATFLAT